jgi:SAM-dependent methyltransferase
MPDRERKTDVHATVTAYASVARAYECGRPGYPANGAERIPLAGASVDAVAVATAFHWFDAPRALVEIGRVLRPGGTLAILWNERDPRDETQRALTALLEPHRHDEPRQSDEAWLTAFAGRTAFESLRKRDFFHHHSFTVETRVERVRSIGFVAALSDETRASLFEEVRELARRRGQAFALPHLTHVYLARSHLADA